MTVRRAFSLAAAMVLLSPLAAVAWPICAPGQHCPMAAALVDGPPCHGTAIEADNCCVTGTSAEPAEAVSVIATTAPASDDGLSAPGVEPGRTVSLFRRDNTSSTPRYRLFRALLI